MDGSVAKGAESVLTPFAGRDVLGFRLRGQAAMVRGGACASVVEGS